MKGRDVEPRHLGDGGDEGKRRRRRRFSATGGAGPTATTRETGGDRRPKGGADEGKRRPRGAVLHVLRDSSACLSLSLRESTRLLL
ncbi:hypothetical protein GUJ93_ZPchr0013g35380 [Zizania palustris]|uniref:Uncharacterized protein n=1 Tax=Zizania palustris TaxID=103762 RepID=A0A8J5WX98_ZIZPA|nr:hypothetical protein GUJ93_ZPchr0013g35380 [Zizania palustris]